MLVLYPGSFPSGLVVPQMLQWPGLVVLSQVAFLALVLLQVVFTSLSLELSFLFSSSSLLLVGVALQEQILINLHHGCSGSTFCSLYFSITFHLLWFILIKSYPITFWDHRSVFDMFKLPL